MPLRYKPAWRWVRNVALLGLALFLPVFMLHTSPAKRLVKSLASFAVARWIEMDLDVENLDYRLWRGEARAEAVTLRSREGDLPLELEVERVDLEITWGLHLLLELQRPRLKIIVPVDTGSTDESDFTFAFPSSLPDLRVLEGRILVGSHVGFTVETGAFELQGTQGPDIYEATVRVPEVKVELGERRIALGPLRAELGLREDRLLIKNVELIAGESRLGAQGSLEAVPGLAGVLDIDYLLDTTLLGEVLTQDALTGSVSGRAHVELEDGHLRATSSFPGTFVLYGKARVEVDGELQFDDSLVHVNPLTVRAYDGRAELEARLDLRGGGRQEFRARCEGLDVVALANDLLEEDLPLASLARVDGELALEGWRLDGADGRVEIQLTPQKRQGKIPVGGTLSLVGGVMDFELQANLDSEVFATELSLTGRVKPENIQARYQARMNDLGTAETWLRELDLLPGGVMPTELMGGLSATGELTGPILDPSWTAVVESRNLRLGRAPFRLTAEADGTLEGARFESLRLEPTAGRLGARGVMAFDSSKSWDLDVEITDLPILPLTDRLDIPVMGKLDARGKVYGSAADPDWNFTALLDELPGQAEVSLEKKGRRLAMTELRVFHENSFLAGSGAYLLDSESVELQLGWKDLSLARLLDFPSDIEGMDGRLSGDLEMEGPWNAPKGRAHLDLRDAFLHGREIVPLALNLESDGEKVEVGLEREGRRLARGTGRLQAPYPLQVEVDLAALPLTALLQGLTGFQAELGAAGILDIDLVATRLDELRYRARFEQFDLDLPSRKLHASPFTIEGDLGSVRVSELELSSEIGTFAVRGAIPLKEEGEFDLALSGEVGLSFPEAIFPEVQSRGRARIDARVTGTLADPRPVGEIEIVEASGSWEGIEWSDFDLRASAENGLLRIESAKGGLMGGRVDFQGLIPFSLPESTESGRIEVSLQGVDLGRLVPEEVEVRPTIIVDAAGVVEGSRLTIEGLDGSGEITRLLVGVEQYQIQNPEPVRWRLEAGTLSLSKLQLTGNETDVTVALSPIRFGEHFFWTASIQGKLEHTFLNPFLGGVPGMRIAGTSDLDFRLGQGPDGFDIQGRGIVKGGRLVIPQPPMVLSNLGGELSFEETTVKVSGLTARVGGGELSGEGVVDLQRPEVPQVDFKMTADEVSLQVMEGLRGRFGGSLRFRGRPGDFLLSGRLRMLQGLFDMEFDVDEGMGGSQDLVLVGPAMEESFEDRVSLDILFDTERNLRIENSLVRLEASGNLSVSGTLADPELSGTFNFKQDGTFQLGRNRFQLVSGRVDIDDYPLEPPEIQVSALTRVGTTLIRLDADGDIDDLRTRLSAPEEAGLTEGDLMSLLVTGRTLEKAGEGGQQMATSWAMSSLADMLHEGWGRAFTFGGPPSGAGPVTLSEEKDPTSRFTVGFPITDDLSLTYSMALDETESQLWILDYQIARNLWIRAIQENSSQYTLGFSHRFELDWTRSPYETAGRSAATEIVDSVSLEGQLPASGSEPLKKRARLKAGDRYDYWRAREDAAAMEALLVREGYRSAVVEVEGRPASDGDKLAIVFLVEAGSPTELGWEGEDPGADFRKRIEAAWTGRIPEEFLLPDLAARATRELKANRYYQARVGGTVEETESGRRVIFDVHRGPRGSKVVLDFVGNQRLTDNELAESLPSTSSPVFFAVLDRPSEIEKGLRLRYASIGCLNASIGEVETRIDAVTQDLRVTIPVSEGVLSKVLEIRFEGAEAFAESYLLDTVNMSEGNPFTMSDVRNGQALLRAFYREEGFPDARIKSVMEWTPEGVRVSFQVEEGHPVRVGQIRIVGQHKTRDWVIRRELTFKEGDPLKASELQRSQKRLFDLGVFRSADVRIESESRGEEVQDVVVQVVEQADLDVNYGLRYNFRSTEEATAEASAEGVEGNIRARFVNTLGRGSNLTASAFIRGEGDLYRISYQVPRFFGWRLPTQLYFEREQDIRQKDLDIGIDQWNVSFQQTRRLEEGVSAFRDKLSLQWNVSFGRFVLVNGTALRTNEVSVEEAAFRTEYRTVLGVSLIEDRRDSIANPTRGRFSNVTFQVAPEVLGSDTAYYRTYGQLFYFYPIRKGLIWASSYRLGLAAGSEEFLFIDNRFTAGGANSVRGFDQNTLGPFVDVDDVRVYLGGQAVAVMNQEIRFPIYKSLHGGAYYDVGNVFARVKDIRLSDMRHSLGAGLRYVLPVGAIRLDWARVLNPQPEDRLNRFHFSFGYAF